MVMHSWTPDKYPILDLLRISFLFLCSRFTYSLLQLFCITLAWVFLLDEFMVTVERSRTWMFLKVGVSYFLSMLVLLHYNQKIIRFWIRVVPRMPTLHLLFHSYYVCSRWVLQSHRFFFHGATLCVNFLLRFFGWCF